MTLWGASLNEASGVSVSECNAELWSIRMHMTEATEIII